MSVKNDVLTILEANRETYMSGSRLAKDLFVSRNAVWKAINSLKEEGYFIESTKAGYKISSSNALPSVEGIRLSLKEIYKDTPLEIHKITASTNLRAKELLLLGAKNHTTVIALSQTAGKGRFGRTFVSDEKLGIYVSFIIKPTINHPLSTRFTIIAAVAAMRVIKNYTSKPVSIKWVNDIYIENKKVCGILTQANTDFESGEIDSLIVGMGINLNSSYLPKELENKACAIDNKELNLNKFLGELINSMFDLSTANFTDTLSEYRKNNLVMGKTVTYEQDGNICEGTAVDIDKNGHLILECKGEKTVLLSGEISLKDIF